MKRVRIWPWPLTRQSLRLRGFGAPHQQPQQRAQQRALPHASQWLGALSQYVPSRRESSAGPRKRIYFFVCEAGTSQTLSSFFTSSARPDCGGFIRKPIPLPSAESSAAQPVWMLTAMPAGRSPLPGLRGLCGEPGPGGVCARRNSLGKALGSVLLRLPRAGASPLRVAVTTNHLPWCTAVSALTPRRACAANRSTQYARQGAYWRCSNRPSARAARPQTPPRRGARAHLGPSCRRDQPRLP